MCSLKIVRSFVVEKKNKKRTHIILVKIVKREYIMIFNIYINIMIEINVKLSKGSSVEEQIP